MKLFLTKACLGVCQFSYIAHTFRKSVKTFLHQSLCYISTPEPCINISFLFLKVNCSQLHPTRMFGLPHISSMFSTGYMILGNASAT